MLVLGLDIGTTGTKGLAFDGDGLVRASAGRSYPMHSPQPHYRELDPRQVLNAVHEVIGGIVAQVGRGEITAICSSALGEAVVPVDRHGRSLAFSPTAIDGRADEQIAEITASVAPEDFFRMTGQVVHPILTLAKILWWRRHRPEVFREAARFLCWNEMLALELGVEPAIAPSLAARTGMFDARGGRWSEDILSRFELDPGRLGRIVPAGAVVDAVPDRRAEELGLARGCRLVSGGWDQACAALGAGAVSEGLVVNSIGTTDSLNATFRCRPADPPMLRSHLTCNPHAIEGLWCSNAFSMSGGNLVQWFRERMGRGWEQPDGTDFHERMTDEARRSEHPIVVLPHFAGTGTPWMDACSRGVFLGMTLATGPGDIARGILEGIAFEMAVNLDRLREAGLPVRRVLAGGGGARNRWLLQLRADLFNVPVTILENKEPGCTACAMLAWHAVAGGARPAELAGTWVRQGETIEPAQGAAGDCRERYMIFQQVYPTLRKLLHQFNVIRPQAGPDRDET